MPVARRGVTTVPASPPTRPEPTVSTPTPIWFQCCSRANESGAIIVIAVPMPAVDATLEAIAAHAPNNPITDVVSVKARSEGRGRRAGLSAQLRGRSSDGGDVSFGLGGRRTPTCSSTRCGSLPPTTASTQTCGRRSPTSRWTAARWSCRPNLVEHDRAVARISHLPHLLAETLAITGAAGGELALGLAAGSFRDGTRVAGSAPGLVRAMCEGNRDALLVALDEALDLLQGARTDLLDNGSTARLVDAGFAARGAYESHERWDIEDVQAGEPDWIERMRDAGRRGGVIRRSET